MGYFGVREGKGGVRNVIMFILGFVDFGKYNVFAVYPPTTGNSIDRIQLKLEPKQLVSLRYARQFPRPPRTKCRVFLNAIFFLLI